MTAPTVRQIIKALEGHRFQNSMAVLAQLDATHADAVRAALSSVPANGRVDLPVLLSSVRAAINAREAGLSPAQQRDLAARANAQLARLREEAARRGIDPNDGSGRYYALSLELDRGHSPSVRNRHDVRSDESGDNKPPPRRSIPRRRSRRLSESADDAVKAISPTLTADAPKLPASAVRSRRATRLLGGRSFLGGEDVTPDSELGFGRPPWLILPNDADPVEPDDFNDDDFDDDGEDL